MQYNYVAYTLSEGVIKGKLQARVEDDARAELEEKGYKILSLKTPSKLDLSKLVPEEKVKAKELLHFCRQTHVMLASGSNLIRALEMLQGEGASRPMKKILARIQERINEGDSLTVSLREFPNTFDEVFISLVEVGEFTGKIGPALEQLAEIMEQQAKAKAEAEAVKAMMMPIFLIGSSMMMLGFMVFVAFPPLINTFDSMDVPIPLPTRLMIMGVEGAVGGIRYIGIGLETISKSFWGSPESRHVGIWSR